MPMSALKECPDSSKHDTDYSGPGDNKDDIHEKEIEDYKLKKAIWSADIYSVDDF